MLSDYEKKKILLQKELNDRLIRKHELEQKKEVLEDLKRAITLIDEKTKRDVERGLTDTVKLRPYEDDVKHIEIAEQQIEGEIEQLDKELMNLGIELDNLKEEHYVKGKEEYLKEMLKEARGLRDEAIELKKRFEDIKEKERAGKRILKISGNI